MMKVRFSAREQRIIVLVVGLGGAILWVYGSFILTPLRRELASLAEQARTARDRLRNLELVTANQAALQDQYRQLEDTVRSLRSLLPAEAELPAVIELLSGLASQARVKIQTVSPQRSLDTREGSVDAREKAMDPGPNVYKEVLIQIDALAGFHELGSFLSLLESQDKPLRVANLRISDNPKDPRRHYVKLLIRSYFATTNPVLLGKDAAAKASPGAR